MDGVRCKQTLFLNVYFLLNTFSQTRELLSILFFGENFRLSMFCFIYFIFMQFEILSTCL